MAAPQPEHFYLPTEPGQRFCSFHAPAASEARAAIVYVHPLAEEMNKTRRMAAMQSRALANAGFAVLQVDLLGCGDSSGDFGDAGWEAWLQDITAATAAIRTRTQAPVWLWGLRTGALLACAAAERSTALAGLLLWQPVVAGQQALQQLLRLKSAGEALGSGKKGVVAGLRAELAAGRTVDVAGYALSPALALALEQASLRNPPSVPRAIWLEVAPRAEARLMPASSAVIEHWKSFCGDLRTQIVQGPAFWQTTEIEDAPELISATCSMLALHSEACPA